METNKEKKNKETQFKQFTLEQILRDPRVRLLEEEIVAALLIQKAVTDSHRKL